MSGLCGKFAESNRLLMLELTPGYCSTETPRDPTYKLKKVVKLKNFPQPHSQITQASPSDL